jgi:hypothetical protein
MTRGDALLTACSQVQCSCRCFCGHPSRRCPQASSKQREPGDALCCIRCCTCTGTHAMLTCSWRFPRPGGEHTRHVIVMPCESMHVSIRSRTCLDWLHPHGLDKLPEGFADAVFVKACSGTAPLHAPHALCRLIADTSSPNDAMCCCCSAVGLVGMCVSSHASCQAANSCCTHLHKHTQCRTPPRQHETRQHHTSRSNCSFV